LSFYDTYTYTYYYIKYTSISTAAPYRQVSLTLKRMTITFENESDVIFYALEKIISYARRTQQIFVAHCVWWLASIIGLESGLVVHIDNLRKCEPSATLVKSVGIIHPDRNQQILSERVISSTPRDLMEDSRIDQVLESAEKCISSSRRLRDTWQRNRIIPIPQSKNQLKKARKVKRLQEENWKNEVERNKRLQKIRDQVITNLSQE